VSMLRRAVGWPLRRVLNPRVAWTVAEVDARLGSQGNSRPPVHARIDGLESVAGRLEARVEELTARVAELSGRVDALAQTAELERLATDEGLAAILEQLRLMEVEIAEAGRGRDADPGEAPARA
jgi:hypothetical protein